MNDTPNQREELFVYHTTTCDNALALMRKKNTDYSTVDDPLKNLRASAIIGIHPAKGILLRCMDKFARIANYVDNGKLEVADESVFDSIRDIINYMVLLGFLLWKITLVGKIVTLEPGPEPVRDFNMYWNFKLGSPINDDKTGGVIIHAFYQNDGPLEGDHITGFGDTPEEARVDCCKKIDEYYRTKTGTVVDRPPAPVEEVPGQWEASHPLG